MKDLKPILPSNTKDIEYYILLTLAISVVFAGTVVFHILEKWSWVDSLYFTVITLATVGYGDLTPTTQLGKLVTVLFVIIGVGIFLGFLNKVMERRMVRHGERFEARRSKKE
jgi:voltage-gated potassium channel Kch